MPKLRLLAKDSETSGTDFAHLARPFFFTVRDEDGNQGWWEADVDPLTRKPQWEQADLDEFTRYCNGFDKWIYHNARFDIQAERSIGVKHPKDVWERIDDTIISAHLLGSGQALNLTDQCLLHLGKNIHPYEERLKLACVEARKFVKKEFPKWMIAKEGLLGMPSVKGSGGDKKSEKDQVWKNDTWLLRVLCKALDLQEPDKECEHLWEDHTCSKCQGHRWWILLREYASADSVYTLMLRKVHEAKLEKLGLTSLYNAKMKMLPALDSMVNRGVTVLGSELGKMRNEYKKESVENGETCLQVAREHNYDLELPKGAANNRSLTTFVFDVLSMPVIKRTHPSDKFPEGNASFDKDVIEEYKKISDGSPLRFIKSLSSKRKRDKSLEYLDSYDSFAVKKRPGYWWLYASLNPTGTSTTRLSCSAPNLQQCSKQESECEDCHGEGCDTCDGTGEDLHSVRNVFGPAPGREWYTADANNIELRIPAYVSGEPDLIELFERSDQPPFYGSQHLLNMSVVYEDVWQEELDAVGVDRVGPHCKEKYKSTFYQYTKNGDFAIQYQCGRETADRAFRRRGSYNKLKSKFVKLEALNRYWVEFAERNGYVETLPDKSINSKRGYPLQCSRGDYGRIVHTVPLNYFVQGSAGWWMIRGIVRCQDQISEWNAQGWDGGMILTVHDEIVFDFPAGVGPEPWKTNLPRMRILQRLMERGGNDIGVPTPVSVSYHAKSWAKGKDLSIKDP